MVGERYPIDPEAPNSPRPRRHRLRALLGFCALVAVVGVGIWLLVGLWQKPKPLAVAAKVPVVVASVRRGDVPVYLSGLGVVQAFNKVTVHTRVDGTLDKVTFVEGQDVKAGDLLGQIDARPFKALLDQAVAAKARDEALLANARIDLRRYETLAKQDSIAIQQRDTQVALVAQDVATVQNDQGQIDYAAVQLAYTAITSPIAGRTGVRMLDAGNIIHAADTLGLVIVTQIEPISVLFTLPEDDFAVVRDEMAKAPLTVAASSRTDSKVLGQGSVLLINNEIDPTTGMIELKATFPNTDHALWPGQFVSTRLLVATRHNAVTIPAAAVQRGPKGDFAYVVKPDQTVEMRSLKVSADDAGGQTAVIESGLTGDETVVIDGQLRLRPGVAVTITPASPPS